MATVFQCLQGTRAGHFHTDFSGGEARCAGCDAHRGIAVRGDAPFGWSYARSGIPFADDAAGSARRRPVPWHGHLAHVPAPFLPALHEHIQRSIGTPTMALHELIAGEMHLDIQIIPPARGAAKVHGQDAHATHPHGRDFFTLVTTGLSARKMAAPAGTDAGLPQRAELMVSLPPDWPGLRRDGTLSPSIRDEANWWPVDWLKAIARLCVEEPCFLKPGRMIPAADDAAPFAFDTDLAYMLIAPSRLHPGSRLLQAEDGTEIAFYALWPLSAAERRCQTRHGLDALLKAMESQGITDLIDPSRDPLTLI